MYVYKSNEIVEVSKGYLTAKILPLDLCAHIENVLSMKVPFIVQPTNGGPLSWELLNMQ